MATERAPLVAPPARRSWGAQARAALSAVLADFARTALPGIGGRGGGVILALLSLLLFATLLPAVARADALDDQVRAIAKELRCPVCSGESVADSHADVSVQMRGIIRQKLEAGESPDQIKAYFVARYGEGILLTPQASGFSLGVWIMPIVALIVGFGVVLAVLRSWSRRDAAPVLAEPAAAPVAAPLPETDDARLEQELARFRQGRARGGGVGG